MATETKLPPIPLNPSNPTVIGREKSLASEAEDHRSAMGRPSDEDSIRHAAADRGIVSAILSRPT